MPKKFWTRARKNEIWDVWNYWIVFFALNPMLTNLQFNETDEKIEKEDCSQFANVKAIYPYRECILNVYPAIFDRKERQKYAINYILLHEVLHLVTWEMNRHREAPETYFTDVWEKTVETIAWAIHEEFLDRKRYGKVSQHHPLSKDKRQC